MTTPEIVPTAIAVPPARLQARLGALLSRWWIAFSLSSICVVSGHLTIKAGLNAASLSPAGTSILGHIVHLLLQSRILAGLAIYLFGTACWMIAVSQKEISFLYPLSSVNYVLVAIASSLLLSESISLRRGEGIVLIVVGMFLLNRRPRAVRA
jgi:uncharacterized membrane protein